jgi:Calcineurin-like phosphoesterase
MANRESGRFNSKRVPLALAIGALCFAGAVATLLWVRNSRKGIPRANTPPGPTFTVPQADLHGPVTVIAYGDMRFTDPSNTTATDPTVRLALVKRVAEEKPDALLLNGDVPWHGGTEDDYAVYRAETQPWRDEHLRVFPALGNHEFSHCEVPRCLANWWAAFPKLKGFRWYSVHLGTNIYVIALDTDDSLLPGSEQRQWLENQLSSLPAGVQFVLFTLHHPPVADIQTRFEVNHNPRPNEIALRNDLRTAAAASSAKFVVISGHIHNYERFFQDGIVYLVSGGGGAKPYPVDRTPPDLYQNTEFPNYHYIKFSLDAGVLRGTMYRYSTSSRTWQPMDAFEVRAK